MVRNRVEKILENKAKFSISGYSIINLLLNEKLTQLSSILKS